MATLQDIFDAWNASGRLKTSIRPDVLPAVVGAAAAVNDTVRADVSAASNVVFHVKNTGTATMSVGTFVFEASIDSTNGTDGTWFAIQAAQTNANTPGTSAALSGIAAGAGNAFAWEASVNGNAWVRVRCTVAVTASSTAQWTIMRGVYATEPIPAIQSHGITGTVTVAGATTGTPATGTAYSLETTAVAVAASVKASAGALFELSLSNPTATAAYVKLYNKASAPVPASDVPVLTIPLPANSAVVQQFGALGKRFATGIALGITGAIGKTDTTATVAGLQIHGTYL